MIKQKANNSLEWQVGLLALVGNNLEGKQRTLALVPVSASETTATKNNAHLLVCPPFIQNSRELTVNPYQFYDFQGHYKDGLLNLQQATHLHYTDWDNWNEIQSFLAIDEYLKDQRQTLFVYRLLLSNLPLNIFIPLGAFTYQLLALSKQKSWRKITPFDLAAAVENSCQ